MEMPITIIQLVTTDGQTRTTDKAKAEMSGTLKDMIHSIANEELSKAIPLANISSQTLDKVLQWIDYHFDDPTNDSDSDDDNQNDESCAKCADDIKDWDTKFFDMEREAFFELLVAANFLNIEALLKTGCKIAAKQIDGKSAEEVRQLWGIDCDLDPEVHERLKKENAWTNK